MTARTCESRGWLRPGLPPSSTERRTKAGGGGGALRQSRTLSALDVKMVYLGEDVMMPRCGATSTGKTGALLAVGGLGAPRARTGGRGRSRARGR